MAAGGLDGAMQFAESILQWRHSLPQELAPSRITSWPLARIWTIVLLAMSYRFECHVYRIAKEEFRTADNQEAVAWCQQQLLEATFELDNIINRAVVHNLVQYAPSSL